VDPGVFASLDDLLVALELRPTGDDRFTAQTGPGQFADRVFGGLFLAQALEAANATVEAKQPQSMHAAFVDVGAPGRPVDVAVERVRDGRSMSTRRVTLQQDDRSILVAIVSYRANGPGPDVAPEMPLAAPPAELTLLQDWARGVPDALQAQAATWIERPPPLEIRMGEAPTFLGGSPGAGTRSHWMRVPREVEGDGALHAALVAYASDLFLVDIVFRAHPDQSGTGRFTAFSVDHAIWFHRPTRFDTWHLYTQDAMSIIGDRGLARGVVHNSAGEAVATIVQEVLVRRIP
jgi:acyl-CoA thioesterase II